METYDAQPRGWEEGPDLLQSVWRYKWLIAVAALLGGLVGYGWAARQPTLYEAVSQVVLTGTAPPLSGEAQPQPIGDPERYIQNQARFIGTTTILEPAAKKTNGKASVEDLRQRMNVEADQDSDAITIAIFDGSATTAALFANAIAEAYEDFVEGQPRRIASQLRSRRVELEAKLDRVNADLATAADKTSLQRRRDALEGQLTQLEKSLAAAEASVGTNLVLRERAVAPEQPVEPAPRRSAAVGMLVGLLVSVALAWLLNSRRAAQEARTEWERSGPPEEALPARGHELAPGNQGWTAGPESFVLASRRPDTVVTTNGRRGHGAIGRLMWRLRARHNLNEPSSNLNKIAGQEGPGAFQGVVDERYSTKVSENGDETSLSSLFVRLDRTLAKEPLDFYSKNLPQATAEEVYAEVSSDMVVILLDDGKGSFRVAGSVGLDPGEQDAIVDQDHEQLRQALWNGVSVLYGTDALGAAAGIPGSQTVGGLLIMPLVQGRTWLGMLLIGRRATQRQHAIPFSDEEIADALLCAMELAALIQALLLAKRLRECMGAFEPSGDWP